MKKSHAAIHRIKTELSILSVPRPGKISHVGDFCPKKQCRWDYRRDSLVLEHMVIPISFTLMTTKGYVFLVHLSILRHQHLTLNTEGAQETSLEWMAESIMDTSGKLFSPFISKKFFRQTQFHTQVL